MSEFGISEEYSRSLGIRQDDIDRWVIQLGDVLMVKYVNIVWNREKNVAEKFYKWRVSIKTKEGMINVKTN